MLVSFHVPGRWPVDLVAAVALTPADRAQGFSNRTSIGPDEAIFFAFPTDTTTPFTMARTGVGLDMLFLDAVGRPVWMARGKPYDAAPYQPPHSYRYVIETPAGWLAAHGITGSTMVAWSPSVMAAW